MSDLIDPITFALMDPTSLLLILTIAWSVVVYLLSASVSLHFSQICAEPTKFFWASFSTPPIRVHRRRIFWGSLTVNLYMVIRLLCTAVWLISFLPAFMIPSYFHFLLAFLILVLTLVTYKVFGIKDD